MSDLDVFLGAADLDVLAATHEKLGSLTGEEQARLAELALGDDSQARANLLMYPHLLAADVRLDALVKGLREGTGSYPALAAAVGVGDLRPDDVPQERRSEVLDALLDLVAGDAGVLGTRAAVALPTVMSAADAADVVPLLVHPAPAVRQNLLVAVLSAIGPAGLRALLDSPGFVDPDEADAVRRRLDEDGVRLDDDSPTPLPSLPMLPDREEWDG